jgi:hypothetical protein
MIGLKCTVVLIDGDLTGEVLIKDSNEPIDFSTRKTKLERFQFFFEVGSAECLFVAAVTNPEERLQCHFALSPELVLEGFDGHFFV